MLSYIVVYFLKDSDDSELTRDDNIENEDCEFFVKKIYTLQEFLNISLNIIEFNPFLLNSNQSVTSSKVFHPINMNEINSRNKDGYSYDKFLYIHSMIPDIVHGLSAGSKKNKEKFNSSMCEMVFTESVIHVDITSRMFYCYNNFKKHPHGTSLVVNKVELEKVVDAIGNNYQKDCLRIISQTDIFKNDHKAIKVCYPGSLQIYLFENLNINHEYWLEKVLEIGTASKSRDRVTDGISKRITLGWGQKQAAVNKDTNIPHPKVFFYDDKKMPFPQFSIKDYEQHFEYKKNISDILSLSQHLLDEFYATEEDVPMNNTLRSELFGKSFGKSFHSSCIGRFEFIDIFVEHGSLLHRHCDYNNDHRNGYTYGASYSYIIKRKVDGLVYRVNFVMATRFHCGAFIDEC